MPRASKRKLNGKKVAKINDSLHYLISILNNENVAANFLNDFLTPEEKMMLAKRLVIFMMLNKDYSPGIISSTLNVSYETIRIYSNQLPYKRTEFIQLLNKVLKREKTGDFWNKIDKMLEPLDNVLKAKTNMKARAKLSA